MNKGNLGEMENTIGDRFDLSLQLYNSQPQLFIIDKLLTNLYRFDIKNIKLLVLYDDINKIYHISDIDSKKLSHYPEGLNNVQDIEKFLKEAQKMKLGHRLKLLKKYKIKLIKLKNTQGHVITEYLEAIEKIKELNELLKSYCPPLTIILNKQRDMKGKITSFSQDDYGLLLCLYLNDNCISSINLKPSDTNFVLEIDSKTHDNFQGYKYNKLLRCVAIIIGNLIRLNGHPYQYIESLAVNWISAWTLINNFTTESVKTEDNIESYRIFEHYIKKYNFMPFKNIIEKFYKDNPGEDLTLLVKLNDENIQKANLLFRKLVTERIIICPS